MIGAGAVQALRLAHFTPTLDEKMSHVSPAQRRQCGQNQIFKEEANPQGGRAGPRARLQVRRIVCVGAKFRQFRSSNRTETEAPSSPSHAQKTPGRSHLFPGLGICSSPGTHVQSWESVQGAQSPGPVTNAKPESSGSAIPAETRKT